jgi:ssDNA-binding Zn-finger/Zn-ribbon topoisomerase 1
MMETSEARPVPEHLRTNVQWVRCLNPTCSRKQEWTAHERLEKCPACGGELAKKKRPVGRTREGSRESGK